MRTSDEARALLTEAIADDVGAIGAYIAPVEVKDSGAIKPGNLRERIRVEWAHHRPASGLTIIEADPSCTHMTNSTAR